MFRAPDASYTTQLVDEAKRYLGMESILDDRESLNLDASQNHEVDRNVKRAEDSLTAKTEEAYCWLIVPRTDLTGDHMGIEWNVEHVSRTGENIIAKMGRKLLSDEAAIDNWAPALLKMELDKVLWKDADCIQIGQLWKHLCSYCYCQTRQLQCARKGDTARIPIVPVFRYRFGNGRRTLHRSFSGNDEDVHQQERLPCQA